MLVVVNKIKGRRRVTSSSVHFALLRRPSAGGRRADRLHRLFRRLRLSESDGGGRRSRGPRTRWKRARASVARASTRSSSEPQCDVLEGRCHASAADRRPASAVAGRQRLRDEEVAPAASPRPGSRRTFTCEGPSGRVDALRASRSRSGKAGEIVVRVGERASLDIATRNRRRHATSSPRARLGAIGAERKRFFARRQRRTVVFRQAIFDVIRWRFSRDDDVGVGAWRVSVAGGPGARPGDEPRDRERRDSMRARRDSSGGRSGTPTKEVEAAGRVLLPMLGAMRRVGAGGARDFVRVVAERDDGACSRPACVPRRGRDGQAIDICSCIVTSCAWTSELRRVNDRGY